MADVARNGWNAGTDEMGDVLGVPAESNRREDGTSKYHGNGPHRQSTHQKQ
jgi:hypothetical protein